MSNSIYLYVPTDGFTSTKTFEPKLQVNGNVKYEEISSSLPPSMRATALSAVTKGKVRNKSRLSFKMPTRREDYYTDTLLATELPGYIDIAIEFSAAPGIKTSVITAAVDNLLKQLSSLGDSSAFNKVNTMDPLYRFS